jgi:hypothetical protein
MPRKGRPEHLLVQAAEDRWLPGCGLPLWQAARTRLRCTSGQPLRAFDLVREPVRRGDSTCSFAHHLSMPNGRLGPSRHV